jgi:phosphoesterase RecJ-like protein
MKVERRAIERIASAHSVVVACHVSPDGDAIGSLLGLGLALQDIHKHVILISPDPLLPEYHHLPCWETIVQPQAGGERSLRKPAVLVSVDCSAPDRLGEVYGADWLSGVPIVNIDHHPTNTCFGEVNWVEPAAAATAQMLAHLVEALHIPLSVEVATCSRRRRN